MWTTSDRQPNGDLKWAKHRDCAKCSDGHKIRYSINFLMPANRLAITCSLIVLTSVTACRPPGDTNAPSKLNSQAKNDSQLASERAKGIDCATTLFMLAAERYVLNQKLGENWVIAVQDADVELRKYSDGTFTVVALPLGMGADAGLRLFAGAYNHMVIRAADAKFRAGALDEAETAYRLVLKHNPAPGDPFRDELKFRLRCIAEARTNADPKIVARKLDDHAPDYDLFSSFSDLDTRQATFVTNLLDIDVGAVSKGASTNGQNTTLK